jgi:transmembrane sensor
MTKEEFQNLLRRYTAGECSEEEIRKVNRWFAGLSNNNPELESREKDEVNAHILRSLKQSLPSGGARGRQRSFVLLKVAASLLAIVLIAYLIFPRIWSVSIDQTVFNSSDNDIRHHHINSTQGVLLVLLPDSSTVELKPSAEISYVENWKSDKREVYLVGEAFFQVERDTSRPFYVYGGEVITKVLGTSFAVNAAKDAKSIKVEVRTGKVSVYREKSVSQNDNGVVLTPNEKVEYFVDNKHWVTSLVDEPKPSPTVSKLDEFVFSDTPLDDIIKTVEKAYAIDVIIERDSLNTCTFTGDVSAMELYDMLNVICKTTGNSYEVRGTKILITGKGCD